MAIEIVVFPIKNGDFPQLCKRLPECESYLSHLEFYEKLKIWWREIHGWTWEGKHQHWCPQDRSPQHDHHRRRGYSNRNITVTLSLIHISQTHAFSFSLLDCMPIQVAGNMWKYVDTSWHIWMIYLPSHCDITVFLMFAMGNYPKVAELIRLVIYVYDYICYLYEFIHKYKVDDPSQWYTMHT